MTYLMLTYQVESMKEHRLKDLKNLGEAKILELNKYQGAHPELVNIHGTLPNYLRKQECEFILLK